MGAILYLSFFIIEFYTSTIKTKVPYTLIVTCIVIEEFSFFIPTMYFMVVHHRIFKEQEKDKKSDEVS